MPAASRKGDTGSGHGCFPPTPAITGSPDVLIDGIPALRRGDALAPHACPNTPPHPRSVADGSSTVLVNGRPLARIGDGIDCGGSVEVGSGTVFADDEGPRETKTLRGWSPCMRACMKEANQRGQAFVRARS
ncbi:MAG TPA: type VI secretion system PAAR protein [Gemmobacter sp.]|nr:type VI secretion system PAAR protein [Gemmobacter sp.]